MFNPNFEGKLEIFSSMHFITLSFLFILFLITIYLAKKFKNDLKKDKVVRCSLAIFLIVFEASYHIWTLINNGYSVDMIPFLGFCSMCNVLTIYFLITNNRKVANITIYYAMTGMIFSIIFIDTDYGFPHFRYFHYFLVHFGFFLGNIYYFSSKKLTIDRKNFNKSSLYLISYTMLLLLVNITFDKNYFYLFESPVKEISDFFGKYYTVLWILAIYLLVTIWYYILKGFIKLEQYITSKKISESL